MRVRGYAWLRARLSAWQHRGYTRIGCARFGRSAWRTATHTPACSAASSARPGMIQPNRSGNQHPGKPCLVSVRFWLRRFPGYFGCVLVAVCVTFWGGLYVHARLCYMCSARFVQVALSGGVLHRGFCIRFPGWVVRDAAGDDHDCFRLHRKPPFSAGVSAQPPEGRTAGGRDLRGPS